MEKKFNFVYITTNLLNGKQYVGDHSTDNLDDGYLGSGKPYFKNALLEYGKENFNREILEYFDTKEEAFNAQEKYIDQFNTLVPNGYNISPKGGHNVQNAMSLATKEKISIKKKELYKIKENHPMFNNGDKIKGDRNGMYGKKHKPESIEKIKNSKKNISEETRKKLKAPKSEEAKRNMSIAAMGRISPRKGVSLSEETKEKIRKTLLEKNKH